MGKRSHRRSSRHERYQAGCIQGLISMFDFRHGRSTKALLADRSRVNKLAVGAGNPSSETIIPGPTKKCESIADAEESKMPMPMADVARTSVKELMEEEMVNEQGSESQLSDCETGLRRSKSDNGNHKKKHLKKRNRSRIKSSEVDVSELDAECSMLENSIQAPDQRHLDNLDLEKIMEELADINRRNPNLNTSSDLAVVEEKLVAAIKLVTKQRQSGSKRFGEEGDRRCSEEFMDALQTVSLNRGLFLKPLQDPNSKLVKHAKNLEDATLGRDQTPRFLSASNFSEEKTKFDASSGRKHRNFFRRRSKSMESYPVAGENDFESPNKIAILKPGSNDAVSNLLLQSQHNMDNKVHNERNTSQFSFTEIKKRLRHAMGKERQAVSPDRLAPKHKNSNNGEKGGAGENFGWSSPNRNHKYTERFFISSPSFKKGESVDKLKDNSSDTVNETSRYPRSGGSNLYVEAKKHLSEMLKNGNENQESMSGQLPKSLGRVLSIPEYSHSPCLGPRKHGDDIFITAQMRLSPRGIVKNDLGGILQENHCNHPSPRRQDLESQSGISGSNSEDKVESLVAGGKTPVGDDIKCYSEIQSTQDTIVPEVQSSPSIVAEIEEMTEPRSQEEEIVDCSSSKLSNDLICGDAEKEDIEVENTGVSSPCFEPPLFEEDQILFSPAVSPSRCLVTGEVEDSDCTADKMGRPSPISVLEPLFTDDDISPASTIFRQVGKEPRHIHFEEQSSASDQGICTRISLEDEESAFEYVEAVLLGSGLNWDEFLLRWLSMYKILDSSLFDEVELFSSRPHHDQKLLFDCANEALEEVCDTYFGCFSGTSFVKLNIQTPPKGMDLIHEIWQRVECRLFLPRPHSLDQLVKTDLARSEKWMNLQSDVQLIAFEMGDTIFIELVEELVLSFEEDAS